MEHRLLVFLSIFIMLFLFQVKEKHESQIKKKCEKNPHKIILLLQSAAEDKRIDITDLAFY